MSTRSLHSEQERIHGMADDRMEQFIPSEDKGVTLKRDIGVWTGISIVVGSMVGSGIFVSTKGVLVGTGSVGLALIVWAICGLVAIMGSLVYVELGCELPRAGGDYEYINQAFGAVPSFTFVWCMIFLIIPAGNAVAGLTFADYVLQPFFPCLSFNPAVRNLLAALIILTVCFINSTTQKTISIVQNVFTAGKIIALIMIIIMGFIAAVKTRMRGFNNPFKFSIDRKDYTNIVSALYSGFYSFAGWNTLNFIGEEVRKPEKEMPIAIISGISLTTVIYLMVNAAYFTVLTPREVVASNAVAVSFAERETMALGMLMSFFVSLSTFGYLNGMIMATSRVAFSAARRRHMPGFVCLINKRSRLPLLAVAVTGAMSLVYLLFSDIYRLINIASCAEFLFVLMSVLGMIVLRYKYPQWKRPFLAPMPIAVFFSLCSAFFMIMTFVSIPMEGLTCVGVIAIGLVVYYFCVFRRGLNRKIMKITANLNRFLQKVTVSDFDRSVVEG